MVVVVFRSRLRPGVDLAAYGIAAEEMEELAALQPGFVSVESFERADGERVTISCFSDEAAALAWRRHPRHLDVQRRGREEFYERYSVSRAEVVDHREWPTEP